MAFEASVVIGTYGNDFWVKLAERRAIPSVPEGIPVYHEHRHTLAQARNAGLEKVKTEFCITLDADDELGPGYVEAMASGKADLRGPARQDIRGQFEIGEPYLPRVWGHTHKCVGSCLRYGNFLVIGTCVRTELLRSVGGWEEWGWSEDWAAWARCHKAGGTVESIPEAIYRAYFNRRSRNKIANRVSVDWHRKIEAAVWPDEKSSVS